MDPSRAITPYDLRLAYRQNKFTFGEQDALLRVCLVGSCRIVPILNFLRAYNDVNGRIFEIVCLNPIECWEGAGTSVEEGVFNRFGSYRIGEVDFLICEHMVNCGMMNTLETSSPNLFDSMGCQPAVTLRLPNWNCMHIYDSETAGFDPAYAALEPRQRAEKLRAETVVHRDRFLRYCRECSFPEMEGWADDNWLRTRLGWTNSHVSLSFSWILFEHIRSAMGLPMADEVRNHPLCMQDMFEPGHTELNKVDYDANGWLF